MENIMAVSICLSLLLCAIVAAIVGILRKQPIIASFGLGLILGPIGILIVYCVIGPKILIQKAKIVLMDLAKKQGDAGS